MLRSLLFLIPFVLVLRSPAAEPFKKTLTSAGRNLRVADCTITSQAAAPGCPVAWSVRKLTLHGGKQEGVDILVVDNGRLRFTVIPTRGMGVRSLTLGDVRLGWDSPVREIVHPAFINLQARDGLGWLEGFNEWLVRCGMESNGHPGKDRFINNVGEEATMDLTLHGRLANLPAQEVELIADRQAPYRIRLRARIDERMFYGPKLELRTEMSTEPGSNAVRVEDVITNRGGQPQEFEMLYHTNYGRPLLEEGSTFLAPIERVTPFNAHAAGGLADFTRYAGPTPGFIEQVYCLRLLPDKDGRTVAMLRNRAKDRGVALRYSIKELPYFTLWKNTTLEKEGYVTGLEPGTNFPNNRRIERMHGRVPKLAPGASRRMTIDFTVLTDRGQVRDVEHEIATIQAGRRPTVDRQPEKKE